MRALSIRQPWAWAITNAGKDVENRSWNTNFRGRFLIHSSSACTINDLGIAFDWMKSRNLVSKLPKLTDFKLGGIIGEAVLVDVIDPKEPTQENVSSWREGGKQYGFMLKDIKPLPYIPCRGLLSFWKAPEDVLNKLGISPDLN